MPKTNNHGDLILLPVKTLKPPKTAKIGLLHVLQDSGVTGNRHEVVSEKEPIYYWEKDGKTFISCAKDYIIRHVGGDCEHGVQPVEAGTRELKHEMEYNPWVNELRIVID